MALTRSTRLSVWCLKAMILKVRSLLLSVLEMVVVVVVVVVVAEEAMEGDLNVAPRVEVA